MNRLLVLSAVLGAAACASAGGGASAKPATAVTTPADPHPAPVAPVVPNRARDGIHFGPSYLHYLVHRRIDIVQSVQGQEQASKLGFGIFASSTIQGPADSAGYPTIVVVDSIVPDSGIALPFTVNLAAARGLTFKGTLRPSGELRNSTPSDTSTAQALGQVLGTFRDFYPHLPEGGLKVGAAWTDTISRSDKTGAFERLTVTSINSSRAASIEDRGGVHSVRIELGAHVTLSGNGTQGGQPLTLTGDGTRHSIEFVAVDGRYLGGESIDSTSLNITLPLQGLVVPVRQVAYSTIRVLP